MEGWWRAPRLRLGRGKCFNRAVEAVDRRTPLPLAPSAAPQVDAGAEGVDRMAPKACAARPEGAGVEAPTSRAAMGHRAGRDGVSPRGYPARRRPAWPWRESAPWSPGGSRGIGRGIALKLAEHGAKLAVHYHRNAEAAADTLARVRERGADGCLVQADLTRAEDLGRLFGQVRETLGAPDIFVSNARPDLPTFYRSPMDVTVDHWRAALDSQAQAFLLGAQEAARSMPDGGRIVAVTYAPGGRTGSWQPWAAMGAAKAALEALVRYFAVALGPRRITVNSVSPGGVFGAPNVVKGGVLRALPPEVQDAIQTWHESGWTPMRRLATAEDAGNAVLLLCREEAGFVTGQVLHVDGGASLMDPVFPLEIQRGS
jgi:NAD(P)-dependent dehydrogenase (short-subunit alcohol dehydrogenase family)